MSTPRLPDSTIWSLRCEAARSGDCDLSRLCSQALWGETHQARSAARRKLAKAVAP
jgi:hypothetical protein